MSEVLTEPAVVPESAPAAAPPVSMTAALHEVTERFGPEPPPAPLGPADAAAQAEEQQRMLAELESFIDTRAQAQADAVVEQLMDELGIDAETLALWTVGDDDWGEPSPDELALLEVAQQDAVYEQASAVAEHVHSLVADWSSDDPAATGVDPGAVFERASEMWPLVAAQVGDGPELAQGVLRLAYEQVVAEQVGLGRIASQVNEERALLRSPGLDGMEVQQVAEELFPFFRQALPGVRDDEIARQAIHAAASAIEERRRAADQRDGHGVRSGSRSLADLRRLTVYHGARVRAARDEAPPNRQLFSRGPLGDLTARYADRIRAEKEARR